MNQYEPAQPVDNRLLELNKISEDALAEVRRIECFRMLHPDLKTQVDRWGRRYYVAASAIPKCTKMEMHRNCGCCNDSPWEASFYYHPNSQDATIKLYGRVDYQVGEDNYDDNPILYKSAEEGLRKLGIPESLIKDVLDRFIVSDEEESE